MPTIRDALLTAFQRHLMTGAQSANIEDRRADAPPVARTFEFDGQEVVLNVARPDGSIMSDDEAIRKYLADRASITP